MANPSTSRPVNHGQFTANLPQSLSSAGLIATLYQRLGGSLHIDRDGKRMRYRPCFGAFIGDGIPQLAEARPSEQFHSAEEWEGAIKLVDYLLTRLDDADRDFVFTAFAHVAAEA